MKEIRLFGLGDLRARELLKNLKMAINSHHSDWKITEVNDVDAIISSGIQIIPALEVNGKMVLQGTASSVAELRSILEATDQIAR